MTNTLIAKLEHPSVVLHWLGCLAFAKETEVWFPAMEVFPHLFPFLIMLHYLTEHCLFFSLFSSLVFPKLWLHRLLLITSFWQMNLVEGEKKTKIEIFRSFNNIFITKIFNKCPTRFWVDIMHYTSTYNIWISWDKFCG